MGGLYPGGGSLYPVGIYFYQTDGPIIGGGCGDGDGGGGGGGVLISGIL